MCLYVFRGRPRLEESPEETSTAFRSVSLTLAILLLSFIDDANAHESSRVLAMTFMVISSLMFAQKFSPATILHAKTLKLCGLRVTNQTGVSI